MRIRLQPATEKQVAEIAALRQTTVKRVLDDLRNSRLCVATRRNQVIATLCLSPKKPWAIDRKYFGKCTKPIYLTAMVVLPDWQRKGIGRLCLAEAQKIVKAWPADAIRLDAYDGSAGAGEFYRRCGFREVGRATYRTVPLIYFERLL